MGQDSYTLKAVRGQMGDAADSSSFDSRTETYEIENNEDILPGLILAKGTGDKQAKLPSASSDIIIGLVRNGEGRKLDPDTGLMENYKQYDQVGIATEEVWFAYTEEAVNKGDQVFVRYATGAGGSQKGHVRTDADTATAVAINAKFDETLTAAGIVKIKLNIAQV